MSSKSLFRSKYLLPDADSSLINDGAVVWQSEKILEVGTYKDVISRHPDVDVVDFSDHLILPGLVNSHDHGTGVGYPRMGAPDFPLEVWLPLLFSARYPDPYIAALYYGSLLLTNGITSTMHQHDPRDPSQLEHELLETARGYRDAGIRATVSLTMGDTHQLLAYIGDDVFFETLPEKLAEEMKEAGFGTYPLGIKDYIDIGTRLTKEWADEPRLKLCWGPYGPYACSNELLQAVHEAAGGAPIQVHLLETFYQQIYSDRYFGKSAVSRLEALSFLSPNVSCAHSIWLTDEDIEILASTQAKVAHCPSSNLRLRSGVAPVLDLIDAGVDVGIGLDGVALNDDQNLLFEMRLARGLAFEPGVGGRFLDARQMIKMATEKGAKIVGRTQGGKLEPGADADLTTMRLDRICYPYLDPRTDLLEAVLLRAQQRDIDTVVVAGEILVRNGTYQKQDIQSIGNQISETFSSHDNADRQKYEKLTDAMIPHLLELYKDW